MEEVEKTTGRRHMLLIGLDIGGLLDCSSRTKLESEYSLGTKYLV